MLTYIFSLLMQHYRTLAEHTFLRFDHKYAALIRFGAFWYVYFCQPLIVVYKIQEAWHVVTFENTMYVLAHAALILV